MKVNVMKGLKIGHFTQKEHATGATVFIFQEPAIGAHFVCGSSPASHELHVLEPEANVTHVDGLALLGGSAYGLPAVMGMMRWLEANKRGWATPHGVVPIVPAAAIYDLAMQTDIPPSAEDVYRACELAREDNPEHGRIGVGCGASVGKLVPHTKRMTGGLGYAQMTLPEGVTVLAYAVVNAVGDVRDLSGRIVAGAVNQQGQFADCEQSLLSGVSEKENDSSNTTLVAFFTDAQFSKSELKRMTKMAAAGIARAISPIYTRYDGDMVFGFSLGQKNGSEMQVGTAAAYLIQRAILHAVEGAIIVE